MNRETCGDCRAPSHWLTRWRETPMSAANSALETPSIGNSYTSIKGSYQGFTRRLCLVFTNPGASLVRDGRPSEDHGKQKCQSMHFLLPERFGLHRAAVSRSGNVSPSSSDSFRLTAGGGEFHVDRSCSSNSNGLAFGQVVRSVKSVIFHPYSHAHVCTCALRDW